MDLLTFLLAPILALPIIWFLKMDSDLTTWLNEKICGKNLRRELTGKVVWVFGASSGIGAALAVELAYYGARLCLSGTKTQNLEAVKNKCLEVNLSLTDEDILVLPFDIVDLDCHQKRYEQVTQHFGYLDILINNAGRAAVSQFDETETEVDRAVFEVNVFAPINLTRVVVRDWYNNQRKGHIVVTSSIAGKQSAPMNSTYCATKHSLHGFYESLRVEGFRKGLSISMICPGPVTSSILERAFTGTLGTEVGPRPPAKIPFMTGKRCAELMVVAIVNKLDESWICVQPLLPFLYISQYMPSIGRWLYPRILSDELLARIKTGNY